MTHNLKFSLLTFAALLATSALSQLTLTASFKLKPLDNPLDKYFNLGQLVDGEKLSALDYFMQDVLPPLYGQRPNNENGTRAEYKEYLLNDRSNDDAAFLTGQELILRSGFKYELYDAVADDGYITQLTRLINPLADRTRLRQPPVLMEHGGSIDPTAYLLASSIQHFPEKWPRTPDDGPIRSWNRSLAFVLANNGFDVFLAETRGANDANKRRVKTKAIKSVLQGKNEEKNMTTAENIRLILEAWDFWQFSQDDIIAHELKSHIDTVLQVTNSKTLLLFTFSLSTPTSLAFLGMRPDYAQKVDGYVAMAPIVSGQGVSFNIKLLFENICPMLPNEIGTLIFTDMMFSEATRKILVTLVRNVEMRYTFAKWLLTLAMGASAKYQTNIDLNLVGHIMRRLSFRMMKQMCQQMRANRLQKFDYGPVKNMVLYKQAQPPLYDLSNMKLRNWIIVSAANDALSTSQSVEHLVSIANPKPAAIFVAPGFNHADLFAGWENDKYVNFPILRYFQQMSYGTGSKGARPGARALDFSAILPKEMMPFLETGLNMTRKAATLPAQVAPVPLDTRVIIEEIGKSVRFLFSEIGESIGQVLKANSGRGANEAAGAGTATSGHYDNEAHAPKDSSNDNNNRAQGAAQSNNLLGAFPNLFQMRLEGLPNFPTLPSLPSLPGLSSLSSAPKAPKIQEGQRADLLPNPAKMLQNFGDFGNLFGLARQSQPAQDQQKQRTDAV